MIKRILIITLVYVSLIRICTCQTITTGAERILFRGVVIDASSQSRLGNAGIVINRSRSAISGQDGTFSLFAFKRDTIVFSMLGYKPVSLVVSDTLSVNEFLTGVYMETDTLYIGEVIIVPRLTNLRAEMMNPKVISDPLVENARNNITNAAYAARTTPAKLGTPDANYNYLRAKKNIEAYEKGGIPSDKMLGLSPFLLIPAAYLLLHGLPDSPEPPKPQISSKDLDELQKRFMEYPRRRVKK
jgi:hypothetical protein